MLMKGPSKMDTILKSLDTSRPALIPQMKILEEHYLIIESNDTYKLTNIGNLIIDEIAPAINIIDIFDDDLEYWGTHDLDFIPQHLLKRINEIKPYTVMSNIPLTEISEPSKTALNSAKTSKYQTSVTTFLFPKFPSILADFKENGVHMCLVVSEKLLSKIKEEKDEELRKLLNDDLNKIYLYPEKMNFMSFGHNEHSFMMRLLTKEGNYDHNYVIAYGPSALKWGKELFDYYLKDSIQVKF